jgi:hypothetical protein
VQGLVLTRGVEVEGKQRIVVDLQEGVGEADVKTWSPRHLGYRLDIGQTVEVEDIHLVVPRAARVRLAFAVLAAAAVCGIEGVQHAMT